MNSKNIPRGDLLCIYEFVTVKVGTLNGKPKEDYKEIIKDYVNNGKQIVTPPFGAGGQALNMDIILRGKNKIFVDEPLQGRFHFLPWRENGWRLIKRICKKNDKEIRYTYMKNGSNIVCFMFSGSGYTYDKPLFYYATMTMLNNKLDVVHKID